MPDDDDDYWEGRARLDPHLVVQSRHSSFKSARSASSFKSVGSRSPSGKWFRNSVVLQPLVDPDRNLAVEKRNSEGFNSNRFITASSLFDNDVSRIRSNSHFAQSMTIVEEEDMFPMDLT